jgi:Flp pilus assembly protein TadD
MRTALDQADLHIAAGDLAHARPLLERIVAAKPDQWDAWERLLPLLARVGDRAALEQHAQRFSGMKGRGHYIYALCWGYRANLQGDQQGAGVYFEQAIKDEARSIPALEALVRLALARHDMDGANRLVERLMRADANNAYAHYARASLDYVAGRQTQAEAALRRSLQLGRTPEALNDLALMLQAGGNLAESESLARAAVALDDQFHQAWDTLATILLRTGQRPDARAAYERALALAANNDHARVELADLYAQDGNRERATELAQSLLARADSLPPELRLRLATVREGLGL